MGARLPLATSRSKAAQSPFHPYPRRKKKAGSAVRVLEHLLTKGVLLSGPKKGRGLVPALTVGTGNGAQNAGLDSTPIFSSGNHFWGLLFQKQGSRMLAVAKLFGGMVSAYQTYCAHQHGRIAHSAVLAFHTWVFPASATQHMQEVFATGATGNAGQTVGRLHLDGLSGRRFSSAVCSPTDHSGQQEHVASS